MFFSLLLVVTSTNFDDLLIYVDLPTQIYMYLSNDVIRHIRKYRNRKPEIIITSLSVPKWPPHISSEIVLCARVCVGLCICMCVCMYVYVCVCVCVCMMCDVYVVIYLSLDLLPDCHDDVISSRDV